LPCVIHQPHSQPWLRCWLPPPPHKPIHWQARTTHRLSFRRSTTSPSLREPGAIGLSSRSLGATSTGGSLRGARCRRQLRLTAAHLRRRHPPALKAGQGCTATDRPLSANEKKRVER